MRDLKVILHFKKYQLGQKLKIFTSILGTPEITVSWMNKCNITVIFHYI